MLASIVSTCKLNDVNPADYIAETLQAILDGHPQNRIEELMPWGFRNKLPCSDVSRRAAEGIGDCIETRQFLKLAGEKAVKAVKVAFLVPSGIRALHPQPSLRPTLPEASLLQMAMICCCKPHRRLQG